MSRKVLAVIRQDPILQDACNRMLSRKEQFKQKMVFIEKQVENAVKEFESADEPDMGLIEARLKEIGALGHYDKNSQHLCVRHEEGSIDLHDNEDENPLAGLFKFLRGQR